MLQDVWKSFEANEVTHSAAHHLMAVHQLRERRGYARVSDVARSLCITKGSVSTAMKHLKERGLVREDENRFLELTEKGMRVVWEVESARQVVQHFLQQGLGMGQADAEVDACKIEHLMSSQARGRLAGFLRFLFSDDPAARRFVAAFREAVEGGGRARPKAEAQASLVCDEIGAVQTEPPAA